MPAHDSAIRVDALLFGGGVAGLWLLDELRRRGSSALLLQSGSLGQGQTVVSQGILHGGLKYTLQGLLTQSAAHIRDMPALWRDCLAGIREPDLSETAVRAEFCYLWRTDGVASKLGMIGAKLGLRVAPRSLSKDERPPILANCPGTVAVLDEQVISPAGLVANLARRNRERILQITPDGVEFRIRRPGQIEAVTVHAPRCPEAESEPSPGGTAASSLGRQPQGIGPHESRQPRRGGIHVAGECRPSGAGVSVPLHSGGLRPRLLAAVPPGLSGDHGTSSRDEEKLAQERSPLSTLSPLTTHHSPLHIHPATVIFTAGAGNAGLRERAGLSTDAMQLRPLHMILARGELPELNGHCVDGKKTRVTITSDVDSAGRRVWQIGGQVSEDGVRMETAELIAHTQTELRAVIPGIDLAGVEWETYRVNRAEGTTRNGGRPETIQILREGNTITAWPTKLVLAPKLAEVIADGIAHIPGISENPWDVLSGWPRPAVALPPWETPTRSVEFIPRERASRVG